MTNAAAGWYDDGAGQQRWWDGSRWTEHVAPQPQLPTDEQVAAPAGWYDDGSGRQRWWDGARWGSYEISTAIPQPGGGIAVEVKPTWPLWFLLLSDQQDPTFVRVRVYAGFDFSTPPSFDAPNQVADVEIDDWEGPPLNMAVHSSQRDVIASLGTEMVGILADVSHQVQAAVDRLDRS